MRFLTVIFAQNTEFYSYVLHLFNTYYQYLTYNCFTVNIILLESSIVIMLFITITKIYNFITITKIYYFITLP